MPDEIVPADSHGLKWEVVTELSEAFRNEISGRQERHSYKAIYRAKVPGGWFVRFYVHGDQVLFYAESEHQWDGGSLP